MFLCTGFADSVNFETVGNDGKVIFPGGGQLKLFYDRLVEFDHLAAFKADQMIVMAGRLGFVPAEFVIEPVLLHEPLFFQRVEGAVYGGQPDLRGLDPHKPMNFFRTQVGMGVDQDLDHADALLGGMDPVGTEML